MFLSRSYLVALCCLLGTLLTVTASPVPENSYEQYERDILEVRGPKKDTTVKAALKIVKGSEHWSLVLGDSVYFDAVSTDEKTKLTTPLVAHQGSLNSNAAKKATSLKADATFASDTALRTAYNELKSIKMTKLPTAVGGNCMDYITMALDLMKSKGYISAVPPEWTKEYNANYKTVKANTWDKWQKEAEEAAKKNKKKGSREVDDEAMEVA